MLSPILYWHMQRRNACSGSNTVNIRVRGEKTQSVPVQLYLAAGESDQATSGHIWLVNLIIIMHGLPADIAIMFSEETAWCLQREHTCSMVWITCHRSNLQQAPSSLYGQVRPETKECRICPVSSVQLLVCMSSMQIWLASSCSTPGSVRAGTVDEAVMQMLHWASSVVASNCQYLAAVFTTKATHISSSKKD